MIVFLSCAGGLLLSFVCGRHIARRLFNTSLLLQVRFSAARSRDELGLVYRPIEETLRDTVPGRRQLLLLLRFF